jgi:hypothetical protein
VGDVHPSMLPRSFAVSTVSGFEQTRDCVQWTDPTKVWWVALHCFSGRGTPSRTLDFAGICCHRHGFLEIKPHGVFASLFCCSSGVDEGSIFEFDARRWLAECYQAYQDAHQQHPRGEVPRFGVVITAGAACQPWIPGTGSANVGLLDPRSRSWFALFRVLFDVNSVLGVVYGGTLCCFFEETPLQSASVDYASQLYRMLFPLKTVCCDSGDLGIVSRRRWWSMNMVVDLPRLRSWRWSWGVLLPNGWELRYQDGKSPPLSCIRCCWRNGWSLPAYRPCALIWRSSTSQSEAEELLAAVGFSIRDLLAVPAKKYDSSLLMRFKEFVDGGGAAFLGCMGHDARDMILGEFPGHSGLGAHLDPAGVDSARGSLTGECWDPNISAPLFRAGWASGRFSVSLVLPALADVALTVLELLSSRHGPTRMEHKQFLLADLDVRSCQDHLCHSCKCGLFLRSASVPLYCSVALLRCRSCGTTYHLDFGWCLVDSRTIKPEILGCREQEAASRLLVVEESPSSSLLSSCSCLLLCCA